MHERRYGTSAPKERAEIVSLRTTIIGVMHKPPRERLKQGQAAPPRAAFAGKRSVYFKGHGFIATRKFSRAALLAGNRIKGPALVEEHASTTVLMPGDAMQIDRYGNLVIAVSKGR
jgi:N-methylhydantoinase A